MIYVDAEGLRAGPEERHRVRGVRVVTGFPGIGAVYSLTIGDESGMRVAVFWERVPLEYYIDGGRVGERER